MDVFTCIDIDECSESTPCDMNANCTNSEGSFDCECLTGYEGNGTYCEGTDSLLYTT